MFALALVLDFDGADTDEATGNPDIKITFHDTVELARNAVIKALISNTAEHINTLEDFIAELAAGNDLEGVDVDSMSPSELIQWVQVNAIGESEDGTLFSYTITEVPTE